jgi:MFS family permease
LSAAPQLDTGGTKARGAWRLIGDPVFGPFFAGRLISTSGVWISNIVSAILVFEISGSALAVGAVSAAQFGPQLLLAPMSGAVADRGNRKAQMIVGRLLVAAGSGTLAITIWAIGVDGLPGAWIVVLAAGIVGLGFVTGGPAMNALIPSLVRPEELTTAVVLNTIPISLSRAVGPAVGAVVAASAGPAVALAMASAANLFFALVVVVLPIGSWKPEKGKDRSVRAGLKFVRRNRPVFRLLVGVAAIGIGADPIITLTPSLADHLGEGAHYVGVLASAFGTGALAATLIMSRLRSIFGLARLGTGGLGLLAGGLLVAGSSPTPTIAVIALVIAGAGLTTALTSLSTQLQEGVPEDFRGRIMGVYAVAFLGSRPVAAVVNGTVSDLTSPPVAFAFVASVIVGIALWIRAAHGTARSLLVDQPPWE